MRNSLAKASLVLVLLSTSACGVARKELHYSGGYPGYKMDEYIFKASDKKELQLLRATMLVAVASGVATVTLASDADGADEFLRRMTLTLEEINYLAGDLRGVDSTGEPHCTGLDSDTECQTRSVLFESNLPQLEYKAARMVIAGLPQRQAAELAGDLGSANFMGIAWKMLKIGLRGVGGAHQGGAAYRSSEEILALAKGDCGDKPADKCLGVTDERLFKLPEASAISSDNALKALPAFFDLVRSSCARLPVKVDPGKTNGITERLELCRSIKYKPALRMNGIQLKAQTPAPPTPPIAS